MVINVYVFIYITIGPKIQIILDYNRKLNRISYFFDTLPFIFEIVLVYLLFFIYYQTKQFI